MTISQQTIDDIRSRADLVAEIGARMTLKKAGANYVGLCPFHGEKSPSFSVSPAKQFFHCFGCGKSGDVFQFLMDHDGKDFHEAVKDLGDRLGVKVEEDQDESSLRQAQERRKAAASLEDLCETAAGFYRKELVRSPAATSYIAKRGITQEIIELYGIGYAPDLASRKPLAAVFPDYSTSAGLVDAGLVAILPEREGREGEERYDRFRDRLMFPIRDVRGRCIGFGGRIINDKVKDAPKYLNSPESPIFLKHKVLFGLHEARAHIAREKLAIVAEGYMDVVAMAQHGIGNAVAALGTALTEDHLRMLLRFTDNVCFVFDGDKAGKKAAWKSLQVALPLLTPSHRLSFLTLPDDNDPDEYLKAHGSEKFNALTAGAPTLSQFLIAHLVDEYGMAGELKSAEAKTQFMVEGEKLCAMMAPTNPLKGMILQEIDTLVGRAPRELPRPAGLSTRDRIMNASRGAPSAGAGLESGGSTKRPWLPREEWLKQQEAGGAGAFNSFNYNQPPLQAPALNKKSLWDRLTDAVVMAPGTAQLHASTILALLDPEVPEEQPLAIALQSLHQIPDRADRYPPDQLQAAIDLLEGAQKTIAKQRLSEVRTELNRMHALGEISESDYISEMSRLRG